MSAPFQHPWLGGLLGDAQAQAIWSPARQLAHMLAFEGAYTHALGQTGKLPPAKAAELANRITSFTPDLDDLRAGTARDGLPVPALVAQLKHAMGANAAAVHSGTTSQDVIDTALALTLRDFNVLLETRLTDATTALAQLRTQHGANTMMGRTRMQAALPLHVADRVRTWADPITQHRARLNRLRPLVEQLQLGGAVGDRAALAPHGDAIAADMAARLGLHNPGAAWHSMRDGVADYAGLLSLITGTLGKMGQDICLMAQQGIDEFTLRSGGGSSAMPHKQNPILAELLVTLARFNATQLSGIHHALIHEQERSGAAWALEWMILPQMAQAAARALATAIEICAMTSRIGSEEVK